MKLNNKKTIGGVLVFMVFAYIMWGHNFIFHKTSGIHLKKNKQVSWEDVNAQFIALEKDCKNLFTAMNGTESTDKK